MTKDPFIQFKMADGIIHCTSSILLPDSVTVLTPEYLNLDAHLFWKHMNLTPNNYNIAPGIKQSQLIVYSCVWVFFLYCSHLISASAWRTETVMRPIPRVSGCQCVRRD